MKHKLTVIGSLAFAVLVTLLWACSDDQMYLVGSVASSAPERYVYPMSFSVPSPSFDGQQSRGDAQWQEGDRVYFIFGTAPDVFWGRGTYTDGEWIVETSQMLSASQNGPLSAAYIVDPESIKGDDSIYLHDVSLYGRSSSFVGDGTYSWDGKCLNVDVKLFPVTWRLRFKGAPDTEIMVTSKSDLYHPWCLSSTSYYGGRVIFPQKSYKETRLTVGADGYTPYVYCLFENEDAGNEIYVKIGDQYYVRTLSASSISKGASGMLKLPADDNLNGWECRGNNQAKYNLAAFIGKDIKVVYFTLGTPNKTDQQARTATYTFAGSSDDGSNDVVVGPLPVYVTNKKSAKIVFEYSQYSNTVESILFSNENGYMYDEFVDLGDCFNYYMSYMLGGSDYSYYDNKECPQIDISVSSSLGGQGYSSGSVSFTSLWREHGYIRNTDGLAFFETFKAKDEPREMLVYKYTLPETEVKDWSGHWVIEVIPRKELYRIIDAFGIYGNVDIDTTDPDCVSIDEQNTGWYLEGDTPDKKQDITILTLDKYAKNRLGRTDQEIQEVWFPSMVEQYGLKAMAGKLQDNKITFDYGSLLYIVNHCEDADTQKHEVYFAQNEKGSFIDLAPVKPSKAKSSQGSAKPAKPQPVASDRLSTPHIRLK